jgi:hypothetical protein
LKKSLYAVLLLAIPGALIAAGIWFFFFKKSSPVKSSGLTGGGGGGGGSGGGNTGVTRFSGVGGRGGGSGSGGGSGAKSNINLSGLFNSALTGAAALFSGGSNLVQGLNVNGTLPTGIYSGGIFGNSNLTGTYTSGQTALDSSFAPFSTQALDFSFLGNSDPFNLNPYSSGAPPGTTFSDVAAFAPGYDSTFTDFSAGNAVLSSSSADFSGGVMSPMADFSAPLDIYGGYNDSGF